MSAVLRCRADQTTDVEQNADVEVSSDGEVPAGVERPPDVERPSNGCRLRSTRVISGDARQKVGRVPTVEVTQALLLWRVVSVQLVVRHPGMTAAVSGDVTEQPVELSTVMT